MCFLLFVVVELRRSELQSRLREALEAGKRVVDLEQHPEVEEEFVRVLHPYDAKSVE